ncbi:chaperone protein dnaJ [Jimgerdemannia flammicorona]|uniref:Chaperone protein dnaJ n=1 Tax=Jimgerdemannia flammicorona TaxID=994334 RepID=A0A433P5K0_9FUNG|nr:chaperone protein dnaJ [Jimgerdemannia flammicorona]
MGMDDNDFGGLGGFNNIFGGGIPHGGAAGSRGGPSFRQSQQSNEAPKPLAVKRILPCTLGDLYTGTTKRLKITRRLLDGASGKPLTTEKVITINVKPGWKTGTKIRFPNEGDELPDGTTQDIEFELEEKPHPVYKRDGDNLHRSVDVTLVEALMGFQKTIETLDGRKLGVSNANTVIQPGQESRVQGEGMPNSKSGKKGDLIIKYNVKLPKQLTPAQKEGLNKVLG